MTERTYCIEGTEYDIYQSASGDWHLEVREYAKEPARYCYEQNFTGLLEHILSKYKLSDELLSHDLKPDEALGEVYIIDYEYPSEGDQAAYVTKRFHLAPWKSAYYLTSEEYDIKWYKTGDCRTHEPTEKTGCVYSRMEALKAILAWYQLPEDEKDE